MQHIFLAFLLINMYKYIYIYMAFIFVLLNINNQNKTTYIVGIKLI